jgi:hypothetical protein
MRRRGTATKLVGPRRAGVAVMRKPFGEHVEGLLVSSSRGDKTAIELFVTGILG